MSEKLTRRGVLQTLVTVPAVGLAGCSLSGGSGTEESAGCSNFDYESDSGDLINEVSVGPSVDAALRQMLLEVVLERPALEETDAAVVNVYNPYDEVKNPAHTIPLNLEGPSMDGESSSGSGGSDRLTKQTTVGKAPLTGTFRVVVADQAGDELADTRFSFECEVNVEN